MTKEKTSATLEARGIEAAARFLDHQGYDILEKFPTHQTGWPDIVADDDGTLVFVKIRIRANASGGMPCEGDTDTMRESFERAAAEYLAANDYVDMPLRFDVISLLVIGDDKAMIRHHINALADNHARDAA